MTARTLAPLLILLLLPLLAPVALASTHDPAWSAADARGDATPLPANLWADLVGASLLDSTLRVEVASATPRTFGTAFVAVYEVEGELRFCAAMEDRALLGYTGTWDLEARAPSDATSAEARFIAGSPPAYEVTGCRDATGAASATFLSLAKPAPAGLSGVVHDEMAALPPPVDGRGADAAAGEPAAFAQAPPTRPTPAGAGALAALPIAALAGALLGALRARGRA